MKNRREFIKISALGGAAILTSTACTSAEDHIDEQETNQVVEPIKPIVVSTWNHGEAANKAAWKILSSGGTAIDAVEAGVKVTESDPENMSVGLGGLPDRDGNVTLDACIMDHKSNCGAVAFLQEIENPISVARKVMEETPHIMLAVKEPLTLLWIRVLKERIYLLKKRKKPGRNG
jgi:N4-(beta-N-acetylglucosaminyl)-L-asparaginase